MSGYIISKKQVPSLPTLKGFGYTASRYNRIPRTDSRRLMLTAEEKNKTNNNNNNQNQTKPQKHTHKKTPTKQVNKKRKNEREKNNKSQH